MPSIENFDLIQYLRLANNGIEEAIADMAEPVSWIAEVDELMFGLLPRLVGIKQPASVILLLNCHSAYRAAVGLGLSGQIVPTFGALRASIESALYANAIVQQPALGQVWLQRHASDAAHEACRAAFSIKKMMKALTKAHRPEFTDHVQQAYDIAIDFGAHPNMRSLINSTTLEDTPENYILNFTYLHGRHTLELSRAIVACYETGIAIFFIMLICFGDQPEWQKEQSERGMALHERIPALLELLEIQTREHW